MINFELKDKYTGTYTDNVLYADIPSSGDMFFAQFRDCKVFVSGIKILDAYEGYLEGNPKYIAMDIVEHTVEEAAREKGMICKMIYPTWRKEEHWPLPPFRYEIMIKHYVESDWFYLKLIWFDAAPPANQSLVEYINSITSQFDFFAITRILTEDEKDYWC